MSIEVIVERVTANDAWVAVVAIHCADGSSVREGDRIFDVETSKAVYEVHAPADGILEHSLKVGDRVLVGSQIAKVLTNDERGPAQGTTTPRTPGFRPPADLQESGGPGPGPVSRALPRFSREARALAAQYGLKTTDFEDSFVTAADVRLRYHQLQSRTGEKTAPPPPRREEGRSGLSGEPIPPGKQDQISALQGGAAAAFMQSVIGSFLDVPPAARHGAGFFETKITDLVAYEASRLMPRFRKLNARYRRGAIEYHASINAGVAFGGGPGLVVYGIAGSDKLSLPAIQDRIVDGFRRYAREKLTPQDIVRPTFTITDLSTAGIEFVFPLLPEGQSCIIAIASNPVRGFGLYVGFDHRLTDGFEVSAFLKQLRQNILDRLPAQRDAGPACEFCGNAVKASPGKVLLRVADSGGQEKFCCLKCLSAIQGL